LISVFTYVDDDEVTSTLQIVGNTGSAVEDTFTLPDLPPISEAFQSDSYYYEPPLIKAMISISRSDIPQYLQKGAFFEALDCEDDGAFEVPSNCLKPDVSIISHDDLIHSLYSLRFWCVYDMSLEIVKLTVGRTKKSHLEDLMVRFPEFNPLLVKMVALMTCEQQETVLVAIREKLGCKVVIYLHETMGFSLPSDDFHSNNTILTTDDVSSIRYLVKEKAFTPSPYSVVYAATHGSLKCLKFFVGLGLTANGDSLVAAARSGHLEVVQYLHETFDLPLTVHAMHRASKAGNLALLRYLHDRFCPWSTQVCAVLAASDSLECLVFAHENGCLWNEKTCAAAAQAGHLRCLAYAHTHGCAWDNETTSAARKFSRYDCLSYAIKNGCPDHTGDLHRATAYKIASMYALLVCILFVFVERWRKGMSVRSYLTLTWDVCFWALIAWSGLHGLHCIAVCSGCVHSRSHFLSSTTCADYLGFITVFVCLVGLCT